jgi:ribonucleoside-diphosphate reductase alpha chain
MKTTNSTGLAFSRTFTSEGDNGYNGVDFTVRDALIESSSGAKVFEQKNVSVPSTWSQTATNIAASKYFHGQLDSPLRETSIKQLIDRVVTTIAANGYSAGYFASHESALAFASDLTYLLVHQYVAFNSPVWFNVGCDLLEPDNTDASWSWDSATKQVVHGHNGYKTPQCSACFINSVKDSMSSILDLAKTEGMLFKGGSGTGSNLSVIRGSNERLTGGGTASGPLSFMKGFDAFAGVIKSGGKTRRAAKMAILNIDHPDIQDFIAAKGKEELKAQALIREGYDGSGPDAEAYSSIFFQNANNSVRVTDEFMEAAISGDTWNLTARVDGSVLKTVDATALLRSIAEETWRCGDPGMQFDTTINKWHTSKFSGRINASNPCSEYMFLDDSACNLASFNLVRFIDESGVFNAQAFVSAVKLMVVAQDILVDMSGYPTELIAKNSHDYRPLGVGYANLGSLLMTLGLPYDSEEGRAAAGAITSIMGAAAYLASAELADAMPRLESAIVCNLATSGSFPGYSLNEDSFIDVMEMHLGQSKKLELHTATVSGQWNQLAKLATTWWSDAIALGTGSGFRNSQVTVLAPTGTIGFLMDCATTGVEPMLGVVTHKKLVGGGYIMSANATVPVALRNLGYDQNEIDAIIAYIDDRGTIEGAPALKQQDIAVFDGAFTPANGVRSISWEGHLRMMAAAQPFLSGAISKTVNLPNSSTIEDIANAYIQAWHLGLKSVAIYRDGSKSAQPLSVSKDSSKEKVAEAVPDLNAPPTAHRHRLPTERAALTHKFALAGHEGYLTIGMYPNGQPGELFVRMAKEGSTISGLMDQFAMMFSVALQHGVPLQVLTSKMVHTRFEPSGWTGDEKMGYAKSPMDYIGRFLEGRFLEGEQLPLFVSPVAAGSVPVPAKLEKDLSSQFGDAPTCSTCGELMQRSGTCFKCGGCGNSSGCS